MEIFFIFAVIAAVLIGVGVLSSQHAKKVRQQWADLARRNGLTYSGGFTMNSQPHITGWYGRTHVTINTVVRGSGKNRSTYTQYHAHVNIPMPQGLNLTREGFFSKLGTFFGGQDVQVGDAQLDAAFIIKAHDVLGAHDLMRLQPVKQALLTFLARHPGMQLNEQHLMFEENGVVSDMKRLQAGMDDLAWLCQTFEAGLTDMGRAPAPPAKVPTRTKSRTLKPVSQPATKAFDHPVTKEFSRPGAPASQATRPAETAEILAPAASGPAAIAGAFRGLERRMEEQGAARAGDLAEVVSPAKAEPPKFEMPKFELPKFDTRIDSAPAAAKAPSSVPEAAPLADFDELVAKLGDAGMFSSDRERVLAQYRDRIYVLDVVVDRVDNTFGFDVPDKLRDGRTLEGHISGTEIRVAARYAPADNERIDRMRNGEAAKVQGTIAAWDDLFKKATLDAF